MKLSTFDYDLEYRPDGNIQIVLRANPLVLKPERVRELCHSLLFLLERGPLDTVPLKAKD